MAEFVLSPGADRSAVLRFIEGLDPAKSWSVEIETHQRRRSLAQNRLQRKWHLEAADQLRDGTAEEKRAYCKLHFGVPILRHESDDFRAQYDRVIRPLPYETKLALMAEPFDFPVTRLMTKDQKTRYLDAIYQHYSSQGARLTGGFDDKG